MNIAVCIKQVPVSNDVTIDPLTHALQRESAQAMVNPADLYALEAAIALKDAAGGVVVVFTMGPPQAEEALRTALSMGADDACLVTDRAFAGADTVATAKALARSIQAYGPFDLLLTGAETSDGATGQVGPMLAECLQLPHVIQVLSLTPEDDAPLSLTLVQKAACNAVRLRVMLPAVCIIAYGANTPRLPTLRSKLAAKKKQITTHTNEALRLPAASVGIAGSPTEVVRSFLPERHASASMLTGDPASLAQQCLTLITQERGNR